MLKRLDYLFVGRTRGSGRMLCAAAVLLVTSGLAAAQSLSVTQHLPRPCVASAGRAAHVILGEMKAGERFERRAGRFTLRLTPVRYDDVKIPVGWEIGVFEPGREEDLSQLTLPLRGPNGRDLVAWHFRNKDNTGPNEGKVDAPGSHREFMISVF